MRLPLGFLMVLLGVFSLSARQITTDEAISVASKFMSSSDLRSAKSDKAELLPMKAPSVNANAATSPYYIFNRGENEGFVIVSGDDRAPMILGYSDKGSFDASNIPPQLKEMMAEWAKQIDGISAGAKHASWSATPSTRADEGVLMETAEWGQGYPFNAYCPMVEGEQAPAGCVATAMAIAMKYHNWPDKTQGGIQEDFNYPEFTLDFSNYSIDWNVLSDSKNSKFADEAGKLIYSAGVAAQMLYGVSESDAEMWPIGHKMRELYAYDKDCQYIEKAKFDNDVWTNMLIEQLYEVGPVIYRGSGSIGHAFVIDGYDGKSLFHVNWGWDGLLNGYYALDFSDVGGSSFSEEQGMIINIKPDKERKEYSKAFVPNCDVYISSTNGGGGWNFMTPNINSGESVMFKAPDLTLNGLVGYIDIGIVDDSDNIIEILNMGHLNNDPNRHCAYPGMSLEYTLTFPGLKEGQRYQLITMESPLAENGNGFAIPRSNDPKDWRLVLGGLVYPSYFYDDNNRSELCEVNFHVDENAPILFTKLIPKDNEFTIYKLKGGDCPDNILQPLKGVTMEIKCYDKDGNPEEPIYVGSTDDGESIGMNISMYSDKYDVYLHYKYDGDTRRDGGVDPSLVIEQDGLIFKKIENGVSLIGYDKIGDSVVIPESVKSEGVDLPVLEVANDALLSAPIKHLTIKGEELKELRNNAFGNIKELESLSMEGVTPNIPNTFPFIKTKINNVYMDRCVQNKLMNQYMTLNWNAWGTVVSHASIYSDDIKFYLSELGDPKNTNDYTNGIYNYGISYVLSEGWLDKVMKSYNIPGVGKVTAAEYLDACPVPLTQMWSYGIDRDQNRIMVRPEIREISIESVKINGQQVAPIENCIYEVASTQNIEVEVNYVLNDSKKMTTFYSSSYNKAVKSETLTGVESVNVESGVKTVFSLDGTIVSSSADEETIKSLTPGIYLIRQGGNVKKIIVR